MYDIYVYAVLYSKEYGFVLFSMFNFKFPLMASVALSDQAFGPQITKFCTNERALFVVTNGLPLSTAYFTPLYSLVQLETV